VIVSPLRGTPKLVAKRPRSSFDRVRRSRTEAADRGWNPVSDAAYEPVYPSQLKSLHKMCKLTHRLPPPHMGRREI